MKRFLIVALVLVSLLLIGANGQFKRTCEPKTPCASSLKDCDLTNDRGGCSDDNHHDPELNRLKNLESSNKPVEDRTITQIIRLEKKVEDSGYRQGKPRTVLNNLGEGKQVRVVGYLLAVKQECGESCNCGLHDVDVTTDNHLVLVNPKVVTDTPLPLNFKRKQQMAAFKLREPASMTAEFTPRVRANGHPNFTADLQSRINKTRHAALWVRVTGQLFFDSEHFKKKPLTRRTSWEIHPILNLEYCSKGRTCKLDSDADWVDLDEQP